MIKVSVLYPQSAGSKFDMDYYVKKHMPMVRQKVGSALKAMAVEQGLSGGQPGTAPTYIAAGHLTFESVEAFQAAFGPHSADIMADIPNYTNIQPIIQVGEIKM